MSIGVNLKNLEKLKKFVHAQPNIKPNRKRGDRAPSSEAVRKRGRLGNKPEGT
jgi:hypothetical protein